MSAYLECHYPEILTEFKAIGAATSLDEIGSGGMISSFSSGGFSNPPIIKAQSLDRGNRIVEMVLLGGPPGAPQSSSQGAAQA